MKNFGVLADLDDKTNPSYWHFYYDPRYCGPDPEAWMEKMAAEWWPMRKALYIGIDLPHVPVMRMPRSVSIILESVIKAMKKKLMLILMLSLIGMTAFASACLSHAQNLIVSKTYYDTGLAFDGSQWTQSPQASPMTFTVYEESLHMSNGSWAIRSGNATVYGFTRRKYIFVGADDVARPANYYIVSDNLDIVHVLELTFTVYGFTSSSVNILPQHLAIPI